MYVAEMFTRGANFEWNRFRKAVRVAMRLSDDLVDLELEKLYKIRDAADTPDEKEMFTKFITKAEQGRRTGLGTHGLGDLLARLRLTYGSEESIEFVDDLYSEIMLGAYRESVNMAKERGAFPIWNAETEDACEFFDRIAELDPELFAEMQKYGRRNGAILTNAPTGSISILSENCSSGIEPMFMTAYDRKRKVDAAKEDVTGLYRDAQGDYWQTYKVFHPNVQRFIDLASTDPHLYGYTLVESDRIGRMPKAQAREYIETHLPDFFIEAGEIDWRTRIHMQGTIQKWIDHSISSTVNLPKGTTAETVEEIYLEAWRSGCKGVTVYVDGSREAQVLSSSVKEDEKSDVTVPPAQEPVAAVTHRGLSTRGEMTKAVFRTVDGVERKVYVYVGTNEQDIPVEVFVTDAGGDEDFLPYGASLGKMISLALKHMVPVEDITRSLSGLKGGSISYSGKVYSSVPDLVAKLLDKAASPSKSSVDVWPEFEDIISEEPETVKEGQGFTKCPSCNDLSVRRVDGCPMCDSCGWSRC
jgi:ribonucleoside-diphosphate reductase alpha chain